MTTQETTQATESTQTTQAPSIADANLSFSQYEALRRGETLEATDKDPATPSAPAKDAGQKKSVDSDPTENGEVEEEVEVEGLDEADKGKTEDVIQDQDKPKKKSGFQRRVDKLNARFADKEREAEYWRQLALKGAGEPKVEGKVETPKADAPGKPDPDKFETHAEWVEAVADWKAELKLKERDEKLAKDKFQNDQNALLKAHYERETSFAKATDDYAEVMEEANYLNDASPTLSEIIVTSENGPALMYELAKSPDEYARICKLSPIAAAREIGKIESKLAATATAEKKPEPKKLTQAPKPIEPVSGKAQATNKDPESMSFSEYERYRREQLRRKRG